MNKSLSLSFFLVLTLGCCVLSDFILDDFESNGVSNWKGLELSSDIKHSGSHSGCWLNTSSPTVVSFNVTKVKKDWSDFSLFSMWIYSAKADNSAYQVVVSSENASSTGMDYYSFQLVLDWEGWKEVSRVIPSGFGKSRYPLGWNKLSNFQIYSSGWDHVPTGTMMCIDDMKLQFVPPSFVEKVNMSGALVPGFDTRFYVPIKGLESNNKETNLKAVIRKGSEYVKSAVWEDTSKAITQSRKLDLKSNEYLLLVVKLKPNSDASAVQGKDIQIDFCLTVSGSPVENCWSFVGKVNPNPASCFKDHPYMLFTHSQISQLQKERAKKTWVDKFLTTMLGYKSRISENFTFPVGVSRWSGYYTCKDGTSLTFNPSSPKAHYCPSDKKNYTGQPYDGGWITNMHNRINQNAYYLAMSYLLEKNATILKTIKGFLIEYSYNYLTYPYHGMDGNESYFSTSGARLLPQTLDESVFVVNLVTTYDIVYEDLTREEKSYIEYNLLRPLYVTIARYDAKQSNWQSWHNAGMVGLGVVLNDDEMINNAIRSFKYQLEESVGDDGIWYEQSMGYHYYALNALQNFAEFAKAKGYDFFHYTVPMKTVSGGKKGLKDMYMGPLHLMMPNFVVPAINDGGEQTLTSNVNYYELAFSEYPEEKELLGWALCTFLANRTRSSLYALKYGQELPEWCTPIGPTENVKNPLKSEYLKASGSAILRKDGDYLFFENGPHGGWHGHYDKLGIVLYSHKTKQVKDYGSLPYRLPMHEEYFRRTLSHSAPMLDGNCQSESKGSGPAVVDGSMEDLQIAKLTTDALNGGNRLRRTMIYIGSDDESTQYPLIFDMNEALIENKSDVSNHFFDVITHSESKQYSFTDSDGKGVSVSSVSATTMGADISWKYLTSLKKTAFKGGIKGVWDLGHTVRYQFDRSDEWSKMDLTDQYVRTGEHSMRWTNHVKTKSVAPSRYLTDWTDVDHVSLQLYNIVPNTEVLYLIIYSENATSSGVDYYRQTIPLTWKGWKVFNWTKNDFAKVRSPMGWDSITGFEFSSSWGHTENETSDLVFDCMKFFREDGREIDAVKGLEQHLLPVEHDRSCFYDSNAPSIPTSKSHTVSIVRKTANYPIVQVLRPFSESESFVTSFVQSGKSFVITTKKETITVNPGDLESDAPCATVKRTSNKKETVTTRLGCNRISLSKNEKDGNVTIVFFPLGGSVLSFRTGDSAPSYDAKTKTVSFNGVKVTSDKNLRVNITSCSVLQDFTFSIDGTVVDAIGSRDFSKKGCVTMTFEANTIQRNVSVVLKELSFSGASQCQLSVALFFVFVLFSLLI